jgi:acyl-coenzyme A synthetase/AMP-(fatty) acid ligase
MTPECGLILLGRRTSSFKIRGYRIEPELIERALLSHSGVKVCRFL